MKFITDFKKFISRGNLVDLAVGIMIGAAFNSIVKSLVDNILTPLISVFLGKAKMENWVWQFQLPTGNEADVSNAITLYYGKFLQSCIDFVILAFIVFLIVKFFNKIIEKAIDPTNKEVPTPKDIELLSEMATTLNSIHEELSSKNK